VGQALAKQDAKTILYTPSMLGVVGRGVLCPCIPLVFIEGTALPRASKQRLYLWGRQQLRSPRVTGVEVMLGPTLHTIQKAAQAEGLRAEYVHELMCRTKTMLGAKVPVVYTLMHLARLSGSPWDRLHQCVKRDRDPYSTFEVRKKSGGNRRICVPAPFLKRTQAWIHQNILCSPGALALIHDASTAYGTGCSAHKNALRHAGASWLVKLDIKDFFESISERQVYHVFRDLGYPALLAFELARLSTRYFYQSWADIAPLRQGRWRWTTADPGKAVPYAKPFQVGHLPQGAPTSPMLANLVVRSMDSDISAIATSAGATYTRYADDIVLSLGESTRATAAALLHAVGEVVTKAGFRINRKKTHIRGPGARKVVTGLTINDAKPRLPRSLKAEVELALFHIEKHGLLGHMERKRSKDPLGYLSHLQGVLLYARQVEPELADAALAAMRRVLEPYAEFLDVFRTFRPGPQSDYMFA